MRLFNCVDLVTGLHVVQKYPQTEEEARQNGLTKYWPSTRCPVHGDAPLHFVGSHKRICCIKQEALTAYHDAIVAGEPITLQDAMNRGMDYYVNDTVFRCGHYGKHTLVGKCYYCSRENSPRMVAKRSGEVWYTPTTPCPRGHTAKRRVDNGLCSQCDATSKEERRIKREKDRPRPFYRQYPDLVISWDEARSMGLNVYRTGKPCKKGHTVYRYVQTRNCLACMGR